MAENPIFLNQVLHGYRDGHTLLASSINLPPDAKRLMLPISDLSGGRIVRGFDEYITGYPLKHIHSYALAKTWYAGEMKRPGCVWTQTLLIDFDDVPRINDIQTLLSLFERPSESEPIFANYNQKLIARNIDIPLLEDSYNYQFSLDFQDVVIYNLYEYPDSSILLGATESYSFEDLFFKIWMQQWPRLKRNFSFCTGAISPRNFMGKALDLQATPIQLIDSAKTAEYKFINVREERDYNYSENSWVELASSSLNNHNEQLLSFFRLFGSDAQGERSAFKPLTEAYLFLTKLKPQLQNCIQKIAELFKEPTNANSLKTYLFGGKGRKSEKYLPVYDELAVLFYLSVTEYNFSFDYQRLEYEKRFVDLFFNMKGEQMEILKQIIKIGPNIQGEVALIALANELSDSNNLNILWKDKQLSLTFILLNPMLVYDKEFWKINSVHHGEIIYYLLQSPDLEWQWDKILSILIRLKSNIDVDDINLDTSYIVVSILNAVNNINTDTLPENWLRYLKAHEKDVLFWIKNVDHIEDQTIEILVSILNPNSSAVSKAGAEKWINYFEQFSQTGLNSVPLEIHAFSIALVLNAKNPSFIRLYNFSLEIVYFALAKEILSHNAWRRIEIHTKPLGLFKDWDRCKKLINAVVDHFIENQWNIYLVADQVQSMDIKERLLSRYRKKK